LCLCCVDVFFACGGGGGLGVGGGGGGGLGLLWPTGQGGGSRSNFRKIPEETIKIGADW